MRRLFSLVFLWTLLCSTLSYVSAAENRIVDIKTVADKDQEKIHLIFSSEYRQSVSTDFENGLVQVTLPHTSFDPSLDFLNINNRFIRILRLVKAGDNTIMEVHFADPAFDAVGMIKEQNEGMQLTLLLNRSAKFAESEVEPVKEPVSESGGLDARQGSQLSSESFLDSNMTVNIVKMLVALFLLLLFFYLLLWAYNRFFVTRFRFNKGKYDIKVSSSYHISPKQKIMVLEINGSAYACGVTASQISLISKVSPESFSEYISGLDAGGGRELSFSDIRMQYQEAKKKQETLKDAVQSDSKFASELIKRIKGLKPLD